MRKWLISDYGKSVTVMAGREISRVNGAVVFNDGERFGAFCVDGHSVAPSELGLDGEKIVVSLLGAGLPGVKVLVSRTSFTVNLAQEEQKSAALAVINGLEASLSGTSTSVVAAIDSQSVNIRRVGKRTWMMTMPPDVVLSMGTQWVRCTVGTTEDNSVGEQVDETYLTTRGRRVLASLRVFDPRIKTVAITGDAVAICVKYPGRRGKKPVVVRRAFKVARAAAAA